MALDRRNFLKTLGLAGITLTVGKTFAAAAKNDSGTEFSGVLIDTTRCVGCRTCETACAMSNGLPGISGQSDGGERKTSEKSWTAVSEYRIDGNAVYVKKQCMHCMQPACASACLTKAMYKTDEGPVIWRESKCMGCRSCMISCPFDMPKFEYNSPNPKVQKCQMCFSRLCDGKKPVCVENCPAEALIYGKRSDIIEIAKARIYATPEKYNHKIYGENEVGGTDVLYLSSVPFEKIGFRNDLGTTPSPEHNKNFLYSVPMVLLLWPVFLNALKNAKNERNKTTENEEGDKK